MGESATTTTRPGLPSGAQAAWVLPCPMARAQPCEPSLWATKD